MDKYLEIFYRGVGESSGLLKANWKMSLPTPLKIICGWYPKSSTGTERDILMCLVLSGSVRHFNMLLCRYHGDFAPIVRYRSFFSEWMIYWKHYQKILLLRNLRLLSARILALQLKSLRFLLYIWDHPVASSFFFVTLPFFQKARF